VLFENVKEAVNAWEGKEREERWKRKRDEDDVDMCKISSLLLNQNEQDPFLLLNSRAHSYVWLLEVKKTM